MLITYNYPINACWTLLPYNVDYSIRKIKGYRLGFILIGFDKNVGADRLLHPVKSVLVLHCQCPLYETLALKDYHVFFFNPLPTGVLFHCHM